MGFRHTLFTTYADPLGLLGTIRLRDLPDLMMYMQKDATEKDMWQVWLHKAQGMSYDAYKKEVQKQAKQNAKRLAKSYTATEDRGDIIDFGNQFIVPVEPTAMTAEIIHKGGAMNGDI